MNDTGVRRVWILPGFTAILVTVLLLWLAGTVADLLRMSGGFSPLADRSRLSLERLDDRASVRVRELSLPADLALPLAHGDAGIRVSCLCPQGVRTPMLRTADGGRRPSFLADGALSAERVADCVVDGLRREEFLILPHAEVLGYFQRKANDYERWLRGMRRLRDKVVGTPAFLAPEMLLPGAQATPATGCTTSSRRMRRFSIHCL